MLKTEVDPIQKWNEIIADYIGWGKTDDGKKFRKPVGHIAPEPGGYACIEEFYLRELIFHKDYNWLNGVIDFIEAKGYTFHVATGNVRVGRKGFEHSPEYHLPIGSTDQRRDFAILHTIIQFIKWERKKLDISR